MSSSSSDTDSVEKRWGTYPTDLEQYDSVALDNSGCMERIEQMEHVLFSKETHLDVIELRDDEGLVSRTIESEEVLKGFVKDLGSNLTVIQIAQTHSLSPLRISKYSLLGILSHYQISPSVLDVISAFGDKHASADEVSECGFYSTFDGTSYEISYQLRYVERNKRKCGDPWSLRQTGVYHKYSAQDELSPENLWILFHPMPKSVAYKRLQETTAAELRGRDTRPDPLRLHLLVFSSYVDNWRLYLHDITRKFLELEDNLMTSELRDREAYTMLNFETLQTLRHLAGKLIPIPTILRASIKTLKSIKDMDDGLRSMSSQSNTSKSGSSRQTQTVNHIKAFEYRLESYLESCHVLQARIENMTKFLADGLNLQNQEITAESNGHLVTLTKDTVDDSATVRAVTIVTLIYLPATFISGLLGSNLFAFNAENTNFEISRQFWIWVALTIPLTFCTLGYWKFRTHRQEKRRAREAEKLHVV